MEMVQLLLDNKIKIDKKLDKNILNEAVRYRKANIAKYFLNKGYDLNLTKINDDFILKLIKEEHDKIWRI